jgi:hypothetical protein
VCLLVAYLVLSEYYETVIRTALDSRAFFCPLRSEIGEATQSNHDLPLCSGYSRNLLEAVEQGRCELVVCVASEKSLSDRGYRALESSHYYRSHACVFVWACPRVDFAKGLELAQREGAAPAVD